MTIQLRKQSQFELFPGSAANPQDRGQGGALFKNLTLSSEHIIVLGIFFLMSWVFFFSLGVERGRKTNSADMAVSVANAAAKVLAPVIKAPAVTGTSQQTASMPQAAPGSPAVTQKVLLPNPAIVPQPPVQKAVVPDNLPVDAYTIQVASFKTKESAQREATILKQKGFQVYVVSKGSHLILCVGNFPGKDDAKRFLNKLRGKYNDCLVRRI